MKVFCSCGEFSEAVPRCPIVDDVAAYYFSNLDDYNRTTFIEAPDHRLVYWSTVD